MDLPITKAEPPITKVPLVKTPGPRTEELVPLASRILALSVFRAAAVVVVAVTATVWDGSWRLPVVTVVVGGVAWWMLAAVLGATSVRFKGRGLPLIGLMLLIDGVGLQVVAYAAGGLDGPLHYLILAHLVVVCLVASYRSGFKLAVWQSLLSLAVFEAVTMGVLETSARSVQRPAGFVAAIWIVTLATSSASALNERELRRQRVESEQFARMAATLEATTFPLAVAEVVVESASELLNASRVALIDLRDRPVVLTGTHGVRRAQADRPGPMLARVVDTQQPLLVTRIDPAIDPWLSGVMPSAASVAVVPLVSRGGTPAVLVVEHARSLGGRLEARVMATTERIAAHASLSLANAWLYQRLSEQATTDALTGLMNRRAFDQVLATELEHSAQVALVLLDLDHFKQVNDVHGHAVGDLVLRATGGVLKEITPPQASAARFGGEEFAVVLPGVSRSEASRFAETVRSSICTADMPVDVTTSVGVCHLDAAPGEPGSLIVAADEALYEAKRAGRNRVVVRDATTTVGGPPPPNSSPDDADADSADPPGAAPAMLASSLFG